MAEAVDGRVPRARIDDFGAGRHDLGQRVHPHNLGLHQVVIAETRGNLRTTASNCSVHSATRGGTMSSEACAVRPAAANFSAT